MPERKRRTLPEQVQDNARKRVRRKERYRPEDLIPSGSTLLNLACSDSIHGAFGLGTMVNLIGDSSSGKTLLALSMLAEICQQDRFDDYRIIYDDVEAAMSFDIEEMFGTKLAERMEAPETDEDGDPRPSDTIQEFQYNVIEALDGDQPFIYVLDSFDALSSDEEINRVYDAIKAHKAGKEAKGTYAMEKAKIGGRALAMVARKLKATKSFVLIISQTRDNIDPMSFQKKTRAGGKALKFYATHEIWMAAGMKKKRKDRIVGANAVVKVSKNKLTGKVRQVDFPVYYDYGVDDIGSCVDFLVSEKWWKKTGMTIDAEEELGIKAGRDKLIRTIENDELEDQLRTITGEAWRDIEDSLKLKRKRRYT